MRYAILAAILETNAYTFGVNGVQKLVFRPGMSANLDMYTPLI